MTPEAIFLAAIGSIIGSLLGYLGLRRSVGAQEKQAQSQQAINLIQEYKGIGDAYRDLNDYVRKGLNEKLEEVSKTLDTEIEKREILEAKFDGESKARKTLQIKLNNLGRQFDKVIETFARYTLWVQTGAQGSTPYIEPWILDKIQNILQAEGEQNDGRETD